MKASNSFDEKLAAQKGHIPIATHDAAVWAVDTLDLAWAGVQAVFGDQATPEHAIALLKIIQERE